MPQNPNVARATPTARELAPERDLERDRDLPTLLAEAVVRLGEATACERVTIWGRGLDGTPTLLAASLQGPGSLSPSEAALDALAELPGVTDLGRDDLPAPLAELPGRDGLNLAAPLCTPGHGPVAFLLAGGSRDPAGRVRPRTLAALEAAARRLALPVAAVLSSRRLERLDREVQRLDRLAALGELVGEIVHEIRNPLVSVKTFLDLLPERAEDAEFRRSFFEVASEELRRVERLLDLVLQHARGAVTDAEEPVAHVAALIGPLAHLVGKRAAQSEIELDVELPELPAAAIGADGLRQVMLNLLLNAVDVSPPRATICVRGWVTGRTVVIEVEDQGPGVPRELRERIFEPFVSTREGRPGGLGLAISRRLVEQAGGRLELRETPAPGCVFRLELSTI